MSDAQRLALEWLPGRYAVCRLSAHDAIPNWAATSIDMFARSEERKSGPHGAKLFSVTRTDRELSIVINEAAVPAGAKAQRGFVAMRIIGTLDFSAVGILSTLTAALADASVPVFAISTYDTDVLLVAQIYQQRAADALARVADFK